MVKKFLSDLKKKFEVPASEEEHASGYVELSASDRKGGKGGNKIIVRPFVLEDFSDIKPIVDALRSREVIALVNIAPLKEKDLVELKRAINKLKKTVDALEGDIAGFGDDYVVAVPDYAEVYRTQSEAIDEA